MPIHQTLVQTVRTTLADHPDTAEKSMFGSRCFMLRGHMLLCVQADGLLCRVSNEHLAAALSLPGTRPMVQGGRTMKGYVHVSADVLADPSTYHQWIQRCLDYNATLPPK